MARRRSNTGVGRSRRLAPPAWHISRCLYGTSQQFRSCYPHNAAAAIFAHNHPSGVPEPSASDRALTNRLKEALALAEVRVLDHIIIGGAEAVSLAERGMI